MGMENSSFFVRRFSHYTVSKPRAEEHPRSWQATPLQAILSSIKSTTLVGWRNRPSFFSHWFILCIFVGRLPVNQYWSLKPHQVYDLQCIEDCHSYQRTIDFCTTFFTLKLADSRARPKWRLSWQLSLIVAGACNERQTKLSSQSPGM